MRHFSLLLLLNCILLIWSCIVVKQSVHASSESPQLPSLPALNASRSDISVSGLSSGSFFAGQLHIAHSQWIKGVGLVAGAPYLCAQGNLAGLTACTATPQLIQSGLLAAEAKKLESVGLIDSLENVKNQQIYIFAGKKDSIIKPEASNKIVEFFDAIEVPKSNVKTNFNSSAEHCMPTNDFGKQCEYLGSPFINNCGFSVAQELLSHIYGQLSAPVRAKSENLMSFSQKPYLEELIHSMADTGYIYIPTACQDKQSSCALHLAFHGCEQYAGKIGTDFVEHAGYNDIAEANNIIVVYPQTKASSPIPYNPMGCWDLYGYAGETYATKAGLQIRIIHRMVEAIVGDL